jgi:two-component system, sporulation sensor kinase B
MDVILFMEQAPGPWYDTHTYIYWNNYLTFAKPDIDKNEILAIQDELKHVVGLLTPLANMQLVEIRFSCSGNPVIFGDRNKFRQTILNLGKNSIEAMPDGGTLNIHVSVYAGHVAILIEDTGLGMDQEQIEKLGTPYYSTKEKGTGLGMMVVYSIVSAMNGQIEVSSRKGIGTAFELRFPAREPVVS